jgi:hypothetical protein
MMLVLALILAGNSAAAPIPSLITVAPSASVPEQRAAAELASYLNNISATPGFHVQPASAANKATPQLAVGYDAAVFVGVQPTLLDGLGMEGLFVSANLSKGIPAGSVALTGSKGAPRGALYAVVEFLEGLGVRFLDRHSLQTRQILQHENAEFTPVFLQFHSGTDVLGWSGCQVGRSSPPRCRHRFLTHARVACSASLLMQRRSLAPGSWLSRAALP